MAGLRLGDALSTSARAVAANLGTYFVVCSVCVLPGTLLDLANELFASDNTPTRCLSQILNLVMTSIAQGALVYVTIEHLTGRRATIGGAFRQGLDRLGPIVVTALLSAFVLVVSAIPGVILMVIFASSGDFGSGQLLCVCGGLIAVVVPCVYVYVLLALAIPAVVIERIGATYGLQRSAELTKGNRLTIFAIYFIVSAATTVIAGVVLLPFFVVVLGDAMDMTTGTPADVSDLTLVGLSFVGFLLQVGLLTYLSALATVMYARIVGINDQVDADKLADVFR